MRTLIKKSILFLLLYSSWTFAAHPNQADVQKILTEYKLPADALSLVALPMHESPERKQFLYNAHASVNPASLIKLVTTFAALEILGPSFNWSTELFTDGVIHGDRLQGNLYFRSGGDPKLTLERLWLLLRDLQLKGVKHIDGNLVLDGSFYQIETLDSFDGQPGDRYRPFMVDGNSLLVNFNAQRFVVTGHLSGAIVNSDPFIPDVLIDNQVKVLPQGKCSNQKVTYHPQQVGQQLQLKVSGTIPAGCSTYKYFSFVEHSRYASGIIRSTWEEMGGSLAGKTLFATTPEDAIRLSSIPSITVTEAIRDVNKFSNNAMAKQLFLTIGALHRMQDDTDDAVVARNIIAQWWREKGIKRSSLVLENGSGLSRSERLSAYELAQMLRIAAQSPYAAEFQASLPLVAIDGTMRNRLKHSPVAGQARIKTGTLKDVRAIAGYSNDKDGHSWVIVAILNHPTNINNAILDRLLNSLYQQSPID